MAEELTGLLANCSLNAGDANTFLDGFIVNITDTLNTEVEKTCYRMETFGTDFQSFLYEQLVMYAKLHLPGMVVTCAKDKNTFPDVSLTYSAWSPKPLAVEIKCGSHHTRTEGGWKETKNSNNDMGTIMSMKKKLSDHSSILYMFVEYSITNTMRRIHRVTCKPFYMYIGKSSDNLLSYREKDGNLRPSRFMDFDRPWVTTKEQFEQLLEATARKRSKAIVLKQLKLLPSEDIREVIRLATLMVADSGGCDAA